MSRHSPCWPWCRRNLFVARENTRVTQENKMSTIPSTEPAVRPMIPNKEGPCLFTPFATVWHCNSQVSNAHHNTQQNFDCSDLTTRARPTCSSSSGLERIFIPLRVRDALVPQHNARKPQLRSHTSFFSSQHSMYEEAHVCDIVPGHSVLRRASLLTQRT
jgi:hypothetical protein